MDADVALFLGGIGLIAVGTIWVLFTFLPWYIAIFFAAGGALVLFGFAISGAGEGRPRN